jgi:hypothetical protein
MYAKGGERALQISKRASHATSSMFAFNDTMVPPGSNREGMKPSRDHQDASAFTFFC